MIIVLLAMLVASLVDLAATILAITSLATGRRGLGFAAVGLAAFAILLNFFDWMVVLRGKDTRGEPITWRDDSELYVIVVVQTCVLLLAAVAAIRRRSR